MANISKIKTPDGTTYDISVTVDQTYDPTSTNPQSGTAVASAISATLGDINSILESLL